MAFYAGWFDVDTALTDITVSAPGFQPQIVHFLAVSLNGSGLATGDRQVMRGWSDGTRDFFASHYEVDGAASTNTDSRTGTVDALNEINNSGAETGNFNTVTFNANGFVITRTDAFAAATRVYYWCANGFTNVYVDAFQLAGSAGTLSSTNPAFQPDCLIVEMGLPTALDTGTASSLWSLGWTDGTTQHCCAYKQTNAVTSNYSAHRISASHVAMNPTATGGAPNEALAFLSFDANGWSLTQTGTSQRRGAVICLKGGPTKLATTTTVQAGTGAFTLSTPSMTPIGALFMANPPLTAGGTGAEAGMMTVGAADGTRQWSIWHHHYDAGTLGTTDPLSRTDEARVFQQYARTGADTVSLTADFSVTSFASGQANLNQNDADATATLVPVLVFGNAVAASTRKAVTGAGPSLLDKLRRHVFLLRLKRGSAFVGPLSAAGGAGGGGSGATARRNSHRGSRMRRLLRRG